jgi:hypothetical protein
LPETPGTVTCKVRVRLVPPGTINPDRYAAVPPLIAGSAVALPPNVDESGTYVVLAGSVTVRSSR